MTCPLLTEGDGGGVADISFTKTAGVGERVCVACTMGPTEVPTDTVSVPSSESPENKVKAQ